MGRLCAMILTAGMLFSAAGVQANTDPARVQDQAGSTGAGDIAHAAKVKKSRFRLPVIGRASWYGHDFQGKKTANGERYNMYGLTAASKTLPLGSYAKVTNLRNNLWVLVRINDRGPMVEGRVIDLSYGAAQALNLVRKGVEKVSIQPLPADEDTIALLDLP